MRSLILDYLNNNTVTGFTVSSNLPYDQNGNPLYFQNFKTLYVAEPITDQEPLFDTLDNMALVEETTTVDIFVVCDAKTKPSNYDTLVSTVKGVRTAVTIDGYTAKNVQVQTSITNDNLVTQFVLQYTKVLNT